MTFGKTLFFFWETVVRTILFGCFIKLKRACVLHKKYYWRKVSSFLKPNSQTPSIDRNRLSPLRFISPLDSLGLALHRGPPTRWRARSVGDRQLWILVRAWRTRMGAFLRHQTSNGCEPFGWVLRATRLYECYAVASYPVLLHNSEMALLMNFAIKIILMLIIVYGAKVSCSETLWNSSD